MEKWGNHLQIVHFPAFWHDVNARIYARISATLSVLLVQKTRSLHERRRKYSCQTDANAQVGNSPGLDHRFWAGGRGRRFGARDT